MYQPIAAFLLSLLLAGCSYDQLYEESSFQKEAGISGTLPAQMDKTSQEATTRLSLEDATVGEKGREKIMVTYQVFGRGIHGMDAAVVFETTPTTYRIKSWGATIGFIDTLYTYRMNYTTRGLILKSGKLLPQYVHQIAHRNGKDLTRTLFYRGGVPYRQIKVKQGEKTTEELKKTPIVLNTLDIQSILYHVLKGLEKTGSCQAKLYLYDARRRASIHFNDAGQEMIENGVNANAIHVCTAYLQTEQGDAILPFLSDPQKPAVRLWIGRVKGYDLPIPLKISVTGSPYGSGALFLKTLSRPAAQMPETKPTTLAPKTS